jgi:hypothetical protein
LFNRLIYYRDKKVVGVFYCVFRAPLRKINEVKDSFEKTLGIESQKHQEMGFDRCIVKLPAIVGGGESAQFDVQPVMWLSSWMTCHRGHIEEYFVRYTKAGTVLQKAIAIEQFKVSTKLADLYKNKMNNLTRHQKTLLQYKNSASGGKKYLERQ